MTAESVGFTAPLIRWAGERGTWHLVTITGEPAEAISMHARLRRLEYGRQRGFGSVKVVATVGGTEWKTSVFPQKESSPPSSSEAVEQQKQWVLLIGKKVMRAEGLAVGDPVSTLLELL